MRRQDKSQPVGLDRAKWLRREPHQASQKTVLDFIPGMEAVGALGNLASAAIGAYGEMKDKSSLTTTDKATVSPSVKPVLNAGLNFHELGMVSHSSNNSLNLIHGSTAF